MQKEIKKEDLAKEAQFWKAIQRASKENPVKLCLK